MQGQILSFYQVNVKPDFILADYELYLKYPLREVEKEWSWVIAKHSDGQPLVGGRRRPLQFSGRGSGATGI